MLLSDMPIIILYSITKQLLSKYIAFRKYIVFQKFSSKMFFETVYFLIEHVNPFHLIWELSFHY